MAKLSREALGQWFDYGLYTTTKTCYIGGEVNHDLAEQAVKGIHALSFIRPEEPITIVLNSPGGEVTHGMAIYDILKEQVSPVIIKAYGEVMSMATLILQAGDTRLVSRYATFMIHAGEDGVVGHPENIRRWVKWADRVDDALYQIYLEAIQRKHPDYTMKRLKEALKFDTLMTAQEAVDLGLADEVISYPVPAPR